VEQPELDGEGAIRGLYGVYSAIFFSALRETISASLALQAIFTLFAANYYYYDDMAHYDRYGNSKIKWYNQ
jgi:hypothetical protein